MATHRDGPAAIAKALGISRTSVYWVVGGEVPEKLNGAVVSVATAASRPKVGGRERDDPETPRTGFLGPGNHMEPVLNAEPVTGLDLPTSLLAFSRKHASRVVCYTGGVQGYGRERRAREPSPRKPP